MRSHSQMTLLTLSSQSKVRHGGANRPGDKLRAQRARTDYETLMAFKYFSLLKLTPLTGRQHQLRGSNRIESFF